MILNLHIEATCLQEFAHLALRAPRYAGLVVPMYARGLLMPRRAQLLRATYCLMRHVDDVLDGDRRVAGDARAYVLAVRRQAAGGHEPARGVAHRLARFVLDRLPRLATPQDDVRGLLLQLIDAMLFDAGRAACRARLSREALEAHHRRTFEAALDLTLLIAGARLRAAELGDLVMAQKALYSLRDLDVDLARGIVNVPRDVLHAGCDLAPGALRGDPRVRAWMHAERNEGTGALDRAEDRMARCTDRAARFVAVPLLAGLQRIATRLDLDPVRATSATGRLRAHATGSA